MKTEKLLWPTIIIVTILLFVWQYTTHTDRVFDHCVCEDGAISYSDGRGACSWHGGIEERVYREIETTYTAQDIGQMILITMLFGPLLGFVILIPIGMLLNRNK